MLSFLRLVSYASSIVVHRVSRSFNAVIRACNADRLSVKGSTQGSCQGMKEMRRAYHTSESGCLYDFLMGGGRYGPMFRRINEFTRKRIRWIKVIADEKVAGPFYSTSMVGPLRRHCSAGRTKTKGRCYSPVATEFNFWTAAGEQSRRNETYRQRRVLLHNHPAESVAYCMRLICNLESRGGQVRCGTSQLRRKNY